MASIEDATKLLDGMIAGKRQYYEKKPNNFILKEIDELVEISATLSDMNKLLGLTQSGYKMFKAMYMTEFHRKINPKDYPSVEIWQQEIDKMIEELKDQRP